MFPDLNNFFVCFITVFVAFRCLTDVVTALVILSSHHAFDLIPTFLQVVVVRLIIGCVSIHNIDDMLCLMTVTRTA